MASNTYAVGNAHLQRLHVELAHVVQAHVQAAVLGGQPVQRTLEGRCHDRSWLPAPQRRVLSRVQQRASVGFKQGHSPRLISSPKLLWGCSAGQLAHVHLTGCALDDSRCMTQRILA